MGFCIKYSGLLAAIVVCLTAGEDAYAQSQPSTLPENVTSSAKAKVKKRPYKKPSKELRAEWAKQAKREAQAKAQAQAEAQAKAQQDAQKAREARENKARAEAEAEAMARADAEVKARQVAEIAAREKPVVVPAKESAVVATPKKARAKSEVHGDYVIGLAAASNRASGRATQFGKFTGVNDDKVYLLGAAHVQSLNERRYWQLKLDDIALHNRSFSFDGGAMGKYKLHFGYSELGNLISNNSQTPFNGAGSAELTLPAGFTKATDTTGMTELAASMKPVDLETRRKEGDVSFAFQPGKNSALSFSLRSYRKNGVKSIGAVVMPNQLGPQGLVLPEPVNYLTNEFRTAADWRGERGQANVEYYYSRFSNSDESLTWDNPFTHAAAYPDRGRTSLPPDNQHQRVSLGASYQLAAATRLSALYERGRMTQNEAFLPYTINPNSAIATSLPRSSADARIDTTLLKLDLAAQPLSRLSLRAGYRHDRTDNKTPRDLYQIVINDTSDQVAVDSPAAQYNQPYSTGRDQMKLDGSYYFGRGMTFKLGFNHEQKEYSHRAVNETLENSYSARLNKRWDAGATAFLDLAQSSRSADGYDAQRVFESRHTSQYIATFGGSPYYDSLPAMRQFDIADRDSNRQGLGITLLPREDLAVGLTANRNDEQYDASQFGLQQRKLISYTLESTLTPDEVSSWSFYYTRQENGWRQASRAWFNVTQAPDPANDWTTRHEDVIDTLGANVTISFMDDTLPVRFAYTYSNIRTDISFTADPASSINTFPMNMPRLKSRRHTADLSGTYSLRDGLNVKVAAVVEFYRSQDWATGGISPGSPVAPGLLTLSGSADPYRMFFLSMALSYHF